MVVIENLQVGQEVTKREVKKIVKKLKTHKLVKDNYFILRLKGEKNLLELVTDRELKRLEQRGKEFALIGWAKTKEAGFLILRDLVGKVAVKYPRFTEKDLEEAFGIVWEIV